MDISSYSTLKTLFLFSAIGKRVGHKMRRY